MFMGTFRIGVTNLLTLAGLWANFGAVKPSVTNLLTLGGVGQKCIRASYQLNWVKIDLTTDQPMVCKFDFLH